jgi:hypothetical protein
MLVGDIACPAFTVTEDEFCVCFTVTFPPQVRREPTTKIMGAELLYGMECTARLLNLG